MITQLSYANGTYHSPPSASSKNGCHFPSLRFYLKFLRIVFTSYTAAKRGQYDGTRWSLSSLAILRALEAVGVCVEITGVDRFQTFDGPCVFIANHMSTLETVVLPGIIQPMKDVTFIVKQNLLEYPLFKHILSARDPIAVTRKHPREDFKRVLEEGTEKLQAGISLVVFPQTTRTTEFDPQHFNTIGIKVAKRAQVPVIPIGLVSDAWGIGKPIKDFGKIDPAKRVYFAFGDPLWVQGRGDAEHEQILDFIRAHIDEKRGVQAFASSR
ncbi:MAG: lysophospholipid acyltransferase family protein [Candidatus Vecturithrix sp.]|nr:lysophospholipid acyltransferase family protein [Candidatus Vecturithrix sp.]